MKLKTNTIIQVAIAILFGLLNGVGVNFFLSPSHLYSSGVTGVSQIVSALFINGVPLLSSIAFWNLAINIPLIYLSWIKLGHRFTLFTLCTIVSSSFFINYLPIIEVTDNLVLAAIAGGVCTGLGVGLCLRFNFSTGGVDIIALVVQKYSGQSVGQLGMIINGLILLSAGILNGWELALASLLSIYVGTKMIDTFYIQQSKVTVSIYTRKAEKIVQELLSQSVRGITVQENAYGGFTKEKVDLVTTVVTKYELYFVKKTVASIDSEAFVNVQPTIEILGRYENSSY